ncbi:MAG TPA: efflux RND transporter periplasmic adaptor subunit [Candidatus Binatia bacterium]|nr:efflux RND transporter periplasmic adaptor subunit [Candidatus Binatia bacterium]
MIAFAVGCQDRNVEAKKAGEANPSEVRLSPELLAGGQIKVEPVLATVEPIVVRTSGKGGFNEDRLSYVSSPLVGRVVEVRARAGDHVETGQLLAVIDSPELGAASSEFVKARADLLLAERSYQLAKELSAAKAMAKKDYQKAEDEFVKATADLRRTRERLVSLGVPEADLDRSLDALHVRSQFNLTAPIAGTVIERTMTLGQNVGAEAGQRLFVIADLSTIWVTADIYEKDLSLIARGEDVVVQTPAWANEEFKGKIEYISNTVDANTRTVKVRCAVDNRELKLKPDMFVTATVVTQASTTTLSVPLAAVHGEGLGQSYVFVAVADDRFAPRPIKLGDKFDGRAAVVSGLTTQDRVVSEGSILLKAEAARQSNG